MIRNSITHECTANDEIETDLEDVVFLPAVVKNEEFRNDGNNTFLTAVKLFSDRKRKCQRCE